MLSWLASLGAQQQRFELAVPLPALTPAERRRLAGGAPGAGAGAAWEAAPALGGEWAEVREEGGRLVDGREYRRFWLVDPHGRETLAATGADSPADRR